MRDGTLCLLVQGNPPLRVLLGWKKSGFGAGKWGGFGGKIESDETPAMAAIRELHEEAGVQSAPEDLKSVGHLTFVFPFKPEWNQTVHVFLAARWTGKPHETDEMRPAWFAVSEIPYAEMWQDGPHWLPRILIGERLRARFVFAADNDTVYRVEIERW